MIEPDRLTDEEVAAALKAMVEARELQEAILLRRGGKPLSESWPIIRRAREERARAIDPR